MTALVEPPIAMPARMALSNASRVRICEGRRSSAAPSPRCGARPSRRARRRRESARGDRGVARAASCRAPRPSTPSWRRCPSPCSGRPSATCTPPISQNSSSLTAAPRDAPPRGASCRCPSRSPRCCQRPRSIGPPVTMIAGTSALAAPMSWPAWSCRSRDSSTTPSSGLARMHSSTSIAIRLRKSIVVGFMRISPSEMVGNSSGKPPAAQTPRFTASATCRRCALQLVSSLQELQMPMTGRPSNICSLKPSALIHERWANPSRS